MGVVFWLIPGNCVGNLTLLHTTDRWFSFSYSRIMNMPKIGLNLIKNCISMYFCVCRPEMIFKDSLLSWIMDVNRKMDAIPANCLKYKRVWLLIPNRTNVMTTEIRPLCTRLNTFQLLSVSLKPLFYLPSRRGGLIRLLILQNFLTCGWSRNVFVQEFLSQ